MSPAKRNAHIAAAVAALLVVVGLLLRWWPDDFRNPSFGEYRTEFLDRWAQDGPHPWHNYLFWSWFAFGYLLQVLAVIAAVPAIGRRGRAANGLVAFAVLACGWQLVGVRGATLINTTTAPYLGPVAGLVLLSAWALGNSARKADEAQRAATVAAGEVPAG